jgi:hypothetical protein
MPITRKTAKQAVSEVKKAHTEQVPQDTELLGFTPAEAKEIEAIAIEKFGKPTVNPKTGVKQWGPQGGQAGGSDGTGKDKAGNPGRDGGTRDSVGGNSGGRSGSQSGDKGTGAGGTSKGSGNGGAGGGGNKTGGTAPKSSKMGKTSSQTPDEGPGEVTAQNVDKGQETNYGKDVDKSKSPNKGSGKAPSLGDVITNFFDNLFSPPDITTPEGAVQAIASAVPAPGFGPAVALGNAMGESVTDLQNDVDAGRVEAETTTDDSMGRVDKIDGVSYSHGNPAADDRAENSSGLGGGMTGGHGGNDGISNGLFGSNKPSSAGPASPAPSTPEPATPPSVPAQDMQQAVFGIPIKSKGNPLNTLGKKWADMNGGLS